MGFKEGGGKKLCPHYFDGITLYGFEGEYVFKKIKKANDFYESHLLKRWEKYILPNSIIYDVGANLGNHTVYFSKRTPAKKVYSFEPVQMNYELLTKNCKENECSNVETFNFAIGAKKCKAIMKINEANFGNSKALMNDDGNIEVYPLDDLNLEIPDFVKIDVEGFELEVLKGMKEILSKSTLVMWIEVTRKTSNDVLNYLEQFNYDLFDYYGCNLLFTKSKTIYNNNERLKKSFEAIGSLSNRTLRSF